MTDPFFLKRRLRMCLTFGLPRATTMPYRRLWLVLVLLMSCRIEAESLFDSFQVHGFASQAYTATSGNNFLGDTSGSGEFNLTEIGLNSSLQPFSNLRVAGQLLYRRAGGSDGGAKVRLDYGLVDYGHPTEQGRVGIRLGRVKNPLGLYNETRDVAFTRPGIYLPQSIYFDRVRNLELAADGGQLYFENSLGNGEIIVQAGAGKPQLDSSVELAFLGRKVAGSVDGTVYTGRIMYEVDGGLIRLAASGALLDMDVDAKPSDYPLDDGTVDVKFWVLSAQYNAENWSLTAEYMNEPVRYRKFDLPYKNFTVEGGYLQATYKFRPHWEALLRYDQSYTDKRSHSGRRLSRLSGSPRRNFYTKDLTLGLTWNVTSSFMVRGEYHLLNGANWIPREDNSDANGYAKNWHMFALQASLRF